jgi:flagellar motility protein MotE (MotC chaperone)
MPSSSFSRLLPARAVAAFLAGLGLAAVALDGAAHSQEAPAPAAGPVATAALPAAVATAIAPAVGAPPENAPGDNAALYCRNIANAAADARYARQVEALDAMNKALTERIEALEAKRTEYETWVKRRDEMMRKADDAVVAIYSQMRPDAAAKQLAVMNDNSAAAILAKLAPRLASAILNEMDAPTAAHLTNVMAGVPAAGKVTKS